MMLEQLYGLRLYSFIRMIYSERNRPNDVLHRHDYYQLLYGYKGEGAVLVGDEPYLISENGIVIVKRNEPHTIRAYTEQFKTLELKFDFIDRSLDFLADKERVCCEDRSGNIKKALRQIEYEAELKDSQSTLIAELELCKLLRLFERESLFAEETMAYGTGIGNESENDDFFNKIRAYVDTKLSEGLTVMDVAKEFHIEYKYLSRLFTTKYGIRLKQYILNRRIELAKEMITSSDVPLAQVAEQCGFGTLHQLERSFKKTEGLSPTQYRRNYKHSYTSVFHEPPPTLLIGDGRKKTKE